MHFNLFSPVTSEKSKALSCLLLSTLFLSTLLLPVSGFSQVDFTNKPSRVIIQKALEENREKRLPVTKTTNEKLGQFLKAAVVKAKSQKKNTSNPFVRFKDGQKVQVYVTVDSIDINTLSSLQAAGLTVEVSDEEINKVQGWIDIDAITKLENLSHVKKITVPSYARPYAGTVTTQGDALLRANELRLLGVTGQGVKVGIISDGANDWRTPAATGDLPAQITTFGNCTPRTADPQNCRSRLTCNEGTAMAEIVHDIAPDAELAVAAVGTSLEFIQQARRLATTFGADIIVDDLGFFGEPYFEDGDIAQAISALPGDILYFSSAGNGANIHYELDYSTRSSTLHNFGVQANVDDDTIGFLVPANQGVFVLLQWSDRYFAPNSDYDLFIFDQNNLVGGSTGFTSTAIEGLCVFNGGGSDEARFAAVDQISGSNRTLEMFFLGSTAIEYPIPTGSVFGHAGVPRALAVAAINAGSSSTAFYSSHGPARIDFPSRQDRAKPDLTAIDGVSVTGAGGFPTTFFGTSAAAPHAAAVAAQLLSTSPDVTPSDVISALVGSASGGGSRNAAGSGLINAISAFERLGIEIDPNGLIPGISGSQRPVLAPIYKLLDDED